MERPQAEQALPAMRVVWPRTGELEPRSTGFEVRPTRLEEPAALAEEHGYVPCKWEQRFDIRQMQAILHMLEHLTKGLPGAVRRMLLRRADQFPGLHGRFLPCHGKLSFQAEEGETRGETWPILENGEKERLW